jgi:tetratricopeptide (TPR) repeat protein
MKKIFLIIVFTIFSIQIHAQIRSEAEKCILKGIEYHKSGEYDKAIEEYDKALIFDKDNVYAMAEKAMTLMRQNKEREAIKLCEKAIEIHPNHQALESIYITLGTCYSHLNLPNKAIEKYNEGLKKFPDHYLLHFNKGISYYGLKYYDEALRSFEEALKTNPFHAGSHNAIARIHQMKNNRIPCIMAYCFFLLIEPEGKRAADNFAELNFVIKSNVERKDKKNITINISSFTSEESEDGDSIKTNDFTTVDMMISLKAALNLTKDKKKQGPHQSYSNYIESMFELLNPDRSINKGFYWEFYAQFFVDLLKANHLETFSYVTFINSGDKKVKKWVLKNEKKISSMYDWVSNYKWNIAEAMHPVEDLEIITRD